MREWALIALVVVSVPLVLKRPLWGVIIYLSLNIIRPEMLFWGGTTGNFVFKSYYILIIAGMFVRHDFAKIDYGALRDLFLMLWLSGAILLSGLLTQYPIFRGYYHVFEMFKGVGICAILYILVRDLDDVKRVQNAMLGCFAFLSVWGLDQHMRGNERLEGLAEGSWADSNGIAAMFVLFLPVALAKVFTSEKKRQFWIAAGIVVLMVAIVVCTKSRSGLLGLITCVAMFGFYARKSGKIALVSLLLFLAVIPFANQNYMERMKTMGGSSDIAYSARDRITLWKIGMMVFADNPLFGTGFLTFPEAKMKYENRFWDQDDEFRNSIFRTENKRVTHNSYIQLLSDCGIIGALPFILLVALGIQRGFKVRRMLLKNPEKSDVLLWICGLSAGIAGYAVCILSIDAVLHMLFYYQFAFISILYQGVRELEASCQMTGAISATRQVAAGNV